MFNSLRSCLFRLLDKTGISQKISSKRLQKRINSERVREEYYVTRNYPLDKTEPLTESEKQQIVDLWGALLPVTSFKEFEMFKKMKGFDPRFLTHHMYLPIVARLLNDYRYTTIFDDKGLLGYIVPTCIRTPHCYVRHIGKDYYDNEMRQISYDDAINVCANKDELFVKPSHETSGGKGAKLLKMKGMSASEKVELIKNELGGRDRDYVVQECLHQHPVMAQFNPTSINTFRITTLMLNGRFSLGSIVLRFGKNGSTVDNWGAGGIMTMVYPDGTINSVGHDIHLNEYTHNGTCVFADCSIPQMPEILRLVEKAHRENFSICKFIGWDIMINENGEPVIIELNSSQPGVIGEQLVAGPIFGDRTQEVIDYCKTKSFHF